VSCVNTVDICMYFFLIFLCGILIEVLFSLECVLVCFFCMDVFFLLLNVIPVLQFCVDSRTSNNSP
jgi:hypothetical protein